MERKFKVELDKLKKDENNRHQESIKIYRVLLIYRSFVSLSNSSSNYNHLLEHLLSLTFTMFILF